MHSTSSTTLTPHTHSRSTYDPQTFVIEQIRHHLGPDVQLILFGSRATGTSHTASDFDIGIVDADITPTAIVRLRGSFDETPRRVDIVNLRHVDPAFSAHVLATGVRV